MMLGRGLRQRWRMILAIVGACVLLAAAPAGANTTYTATSSTISAYAGVPFNDVVVSGVSGACPGSLVYSVGSSIDWGDGSSQSGGIVSYPDMTTFHGLTITGAFTASGRHTYAAQGTYTGTVHVSTIDCPVPGTDEGPGTVPFTANIALDTLNGSQASPAIVGVAGGQFNGAVASFTDVADDTNPADYTASIHWGDGSSASAGEVAAADGGLTVDASHTYSSAGSYPVAVTIDNAGGASIVVHETATVDPAPPAVTFTFSPNTDPVLSREKVTFAISNPTPGVTYQWDFGENDATPGSASSPFVVDATGTSVTHAFRDPKITDTADDIHFSCPVGNPKCATPTMRTAVYVVRAQESITGASAPPIVSASQNIVVVPVQPPVASFDLVRAVGATGGLPAQTVTQPIGIVPQAELPEVDSAAADRIVREDFWFTAEPQLTGTGLNSNVGALTYWLSHPDLTCLPDGTCGQYSDAATGPLVPSDSQLTPVPGEQTLTPGVLPDSGLWADGATDASTGGFGSIEMNFWDQTLADMGSPGGIPEEPQNDETEGDLGPGSLVTGYPPLYDVNLASADGYEGEQGVVGDCFPGYPLGGEANTYTPCESILSKNGFYAQTGPYDSGLGVTFGTFDPSYQAEDEWNLLYNYATVAGVDTPLNNPLGPATGETAGPDGTTVPRTITMMAYNSEGVASTPVTQTVPLIPATGPTVRACLQLTAASGCVTSGVNTVPFTAYNPITVDVNGSSGGTGQILYYAVQIGQPNADNNCGSASTPLPSPSVAPPFPVPAFSDLEEGVFPYHNCDAFAERTINSKEPTPLPPTSGPNRVASASSATTLHSADSIRHAGLGTVTATEPNSAASGSPVIIVPASEVAANPNALQIEFTQPGQYSVSVAAYDYSGLGAITRIDGIVVESGSNAGLCENVNSAPLVIDDAKLGLSGNCVTTITKPGGTKGGDPLLYASTSTMDIDGVPLTPQPGYTLVANVSNASASQVYVTNDCSITSGQLQMSSLGSLCQNPSSGGRLYLALGTGGGGAPGFAYWPQGFNAAQDTALLPSLSGLGKALYGSAGAAADASTGCGTVGGVAWALAPTPTYESLTVADAPCLTFTFDSTSRIAFATDLPQGFGNGTPVPAQVVLQGADVPAVSLLTTTPYANVARAHRAWHVIDGSPISAHAAQAGFPAIPGCGTDAASALMIPGDTDMGGLVDLPGAGAELCFNQKTGDFTGNVKVDIPQPLPIDNVNVGFEVGHGQLLQAGANVTTQIPVGPVIINDLKFDIQTKPVVVAGGLSASIGDIITAQAAVIVHSDPFQFDLDGTVGIASLQFGNFAIDFTSNKAGMHATIGKDFGPVSLNVTVSGGAEWGGPQGFQFYVDGNGSACLFICLGVQGLVSSEGLAACGTINLILVHFSGGFAVMWSGPESGLHLFTGCDLEPYIPAGLQNIAGSSSVRAGPRGSPPERSWSATDAKATTQPTLFAGQSAEVRLHQKHGCLPPTSTSPPPAPRHCIPSVVSVQVHSIATPGTAGETPLVTLTGPPGDPRVITTPSVLGGYDFDTQPLLGSTGASGATGSEPTNEGTALVDQSPVPVVDEVPHSSVDCPTTRKTNISTLSASCTQVTTTTLYVADPGPGKWTLSVDGAAGCNPLAAGCSPPVVDISIADSEPPVTPRQFNPTVMSVKVRHTPQGFTADIDGHSFPSSLLRKRDGLLLAPSVEVPATGLHSLEHLKAGDYDVPSIDSSRVRAIMLKAPKGFEGTMAILDQGPTSNQVLASGIVPSEIPARGTPLLFQPGTDAGTHHIKVFLSNSEGMPSSEMTLAAYTAPSVPKPSGMKIRKIIRHGATVQIEFSPGDAPIADGINLTLSTPNGERLDDLFTPRDLHAIGPLSGIGAAAQAGEYMITLHDVDPTEKIKVGIFGANDGEAGSTASDSMGPAIHARSDRQFLVALRKRHVHQ